MNNNNFGSGFEKLGDILGNVGSKLQQVYGTRLGEEQANEDLAKLTEVSGEPNIAGIQAKLNTGNPFSASGQAYNKIIEQANLGVQTTNWNVQLSNLLQKQLNDPNYDPNTATQTFTKLGLQAIDNTLKNVDPSIQAELRATMLASLDRNVGFIAQKSVSVDAQNKKLSFVNAINDDANLATMYFARGDVQSGLSTIQNQDAKLKLGLQNGAFSANYVAEQRQQSTKNALSQVAIKDGLSTAENINSQLPNTYKLNDDGLAQVKIAQDRAYNSQQADVQRNQLQQHWSIQEYFKRLANGENPPTPLGLTDEQISQAMGIKYGVQSDYANAKAVIDKYKIAGGLINMVQPLTPSEKYNFIYGDAGSVPDNLKQAKGIFDALPPNIKTDFITQYNARNVAIQAQPVAALGLFNSTGNQRLATLIHQGIDPSKGIDPSEVNNYVNLLMTKPLQSSQIRADIINKYQNLAPVMFKKIADATGDAHSQGLQFAMRTPFANQYLAKPITTNLQDNKWVSSRTLKGKWRDGLNTVIAGTDNDIIGMVNGVKATNPAMSYDDIFDATFDTYKGNLALKGDVNKLASPELAKAIGVKEQRTDFRYDPKNDIYQLYEDGKPTNTAITRSLLNSIQPVSTVQRVTDYFKQNYKKISPTLGAVVDIVNDKK